MKLDSIIPEIKKIITDSNKTNDINKLIAFYLLMEVFSFYMVDY